MFQWKLTDLTVKNILSTDESVKRQITDSINENLTDSDLESRYFIDVFCRILYKFSHTVFYINKVNSKIRFIFVILYLLFWYFRNKGHRWKYLLESKRLQVCNLLSMKFIIWGSIQVLFQDKYLKSCIELKNESTTYLK